MNNPIIKASGAIPAYACVKVSSTTNTVEVCTTSTDIVFGVTAGTPATNGNRVEFQISDTQLDIVTMRAGGAIAVGDQLVPDAAGTVVQNASGQFIAMSAATSGQNLTAYKKKAGTSTGGGTPGGSTGQVQFNSSSAFAGDAGLTYDSTTDALTVGGNSTINGVSVGKGNNSGTNNTAVGVSALSVVSTTAAGGSINCTAIGHQAGFSLNGGANNTLIGRNAGYQITGSLGNGSGFDNTIVGSNAGSGLGTGHTNTLIGSGAGQILTSNSNTCVGYGSGPLTITGGGNVFVGANSGQFNTTGNGNVAVGNEALRGASTTLQPLPFKGDASTAIGSNALANVMPGDNKSNTAVGYQAGQDIRTGFYNLAVGNQALVSNIGGSNNTAVGEYCGDGCKQSNNVYVGTSAAYRNWFGTSNVMIGREAGAGNISISNQKDEFPNLSPSTISGQSPYNASENTVIGFEAFRHPKDTEGAAPAVATGTISMTQTPGSPIVVSESTVHGLNTGDPVAFRSSVLNSQAQSGGVTVSANPSLTRLPTPLFSGRTYYVIKIDNFTYQLAQSVVETAPSTNFAAATPVLATSDLAGTGTYTRVTTGTTTANGNTIMGYRAGLAGAGASQFSGTYNTLIGHQAGLVITSGGSNVCIGRSSGGMASGSSNTVIGTAASVLSDSNGNCIIIGKDAVGFGSNTTSIGTTSTTGARLYGVMSTGSAALTIASSTTISPVNPIVFVSGTTPIVTINPPTGFTGGSGGQITIIPTGVFTTTTAGNIALASTAVVSKALIMTYDSGTAKWYPSY